MEVQAFNPSTGRERQVDLGSRPPWSIELILGQGYTETLSQKRKKRF